MAVAVRDDRAGRLSPSAPATDRPHGPIAAAPTRIHYLDWLRVGAIAAVFVYHTLRPFNVDDWNVKNGETSAVLNVAMGFFNTFGLAVLFLLAGAGTRFALRKRTPSTFLRERTARLLVPFVAGTVVLSPIQAFIEATHKGTYSGPFLDYLGPWADDLVHGLFRGFTPAVFGVGYHLWFLGFLFAMSVVALPLCEWLLGPRGRAIVDALARSARWPGASLAFAIPIALLVMVSFPLGRAEHDWLEFGWYLGYFVVGFVLLADDRFMVAVRRDLWLALSVGTIGATGLLVTDFSGWVSTFPARGFDWSYPVMAGLFALEGWAWTVVVLNVGLRVARLQRPVDVHVGDAVLPVYVIHQPVILAVAFFVVQWPLGILPKWAVVFAASLAITLVLVESGLRLRITRVLLGARVRPATAAAAERRHPAGAAPTAGPG